MFSLCSLRVCAFIFVFVGDDDDFFFGGRHKSSAAVVLMVDVENAGVKACVFRSPRLRLLWRGTRSELS
jgi:hypothetical protein